MNGKLVHDVFDVVEGGTFGIGTDLAKHGLEGRFVGKVVVTDELILKKLANDFGQEGELFEIHKTIGQNVGVIFVDGENVFGVDADEWDDWRFEGGDMVAIVFVGLFAVEENFEVSKSLFELGRNGSKSFFESQNGERVESSNDGIAAEEIVKLNGFPSQPNKLAYDASSLLQVDFAKNSHGNPVTHIVEPHRKIYFRNRMGQRRRQSFTLKKIGGLKWRRRVSLIERKNWRQRL